MKGLGRKYSSKADIFYSWKYLDKPSLLKVLPKINYRSIKVIDLGCGSGRSYEIFKSTSLKESNMYGVDSDKYLLQEAKEKYPNAEFIKADLGKWSITGLEELYTLAFSVHVFHYFNKQELNKIFKKIFNILKSNGYFIFLVSHPLRWIDNTNEYFLGGYKTIKTYWDTSMKLHMSTLSDYTMALTSNGFEILQLLEPIPIKEGKADKQNYDKYSTKPSRLLIVSGKR